VLLGISRRDPYRIRTVASGLTSETTYDPGGGGASGDTIYYAVDIEARATDGGAGQHKSMQVGLEWCASSGSPCVRRAYTHEDDDGQQEHKTSNHLKVPFVGRILVLPLLPPYGARPLHRINRPFTTLPRYIDAPFSSLSLWTTPTGRTWLCPWARVCEVTGRGDAMR